MQETEVYEELMDGESKEMKDGFAREWQLGLGLLVAGCHERLAFWSQLSHSLCALAGCDPGEGCRWGCSMYRVL